MDVEVEGSGGGIGGVGLGGSNVCCSILQYVGWVIGNSSRIEFNYV